MDNLIKGFLVLRLPLLLLITVLVIGTACVYYTKQRLEVSRRQWQAEQKTLMDARQRYLKSGEERDLIIRYSEEYQALQTQGFVGAEQRIRWLDGLRVANQQAGLFGVEYQVGAQQNYSGITGFDTRPLALRQSIMKLRLRLLHEGDLMHFFSVLANQKVGLFTINQCTMERGGENTNTIRFEPNLNADCDIAWITVSGVGGQEKK